MKWFDVARTRLRLIWGRRTAELRAGREFLFHIDMEAKFWITPAVELHANHGLKPRRLAEAQELVEENVNEIHRAWARHFPG